MEKNEYIPLQEHIYTYDEIKEFKKNYVMNYMKLIIGII